MTFMGELLPVSSVLGEEGISVLGEDGTSVLDVLQPAQANIRDIKSINVKSLVVFITALSSGMLNNITFAGWFMFI